MKEMINDEQPEGWVDCRLGDAIGFMRNGMVAKQTKDGVGLPISRIETIANGTVDPNRIGFSTDISPRAAEAYRLQRGDILFSHINSPSHLGKTAIYDGIPSTLYHGMNLLMLRANEELITARFLEYGLRLLRISGTFSLVAQHAVNQASINQKKLCELRLPLAPLAEQKRIADKLEAVLGRVEACRARLDRVPDLLKRFRQSVLAAATSGQLTEDWRMAQSDAPNWRIEPLEGIVAEMKNGLVAKQSKEPVGLPMSRIETIAAGSINPDKIGYSTEVTLKQAEPFRLLEGDILFSHINSPAHLGKTAIYKGIPETLFHGMNLLMLRVKTELSLPQFLEFALCNLRGEGVFSMVAQHAVNQASINQKKLRAIEVPLPPLAEQTEIVRRVEALFALADRIEARLATAQRLVERLTPATLSKAFRGDLVPQDPNDEPASKLLERVRTAASPDQKPKRRT